jgi:DNA-binding NtrC family response regulator
MQPDFIWRGSIPVSDNRVPDPRTPVVLVVSADANLRAASARVLQKEGYHVLTAAHSGHAVLACRKAGRIDLLATDLCMDDLSGPALSARLARHCPEMRTVYFANPGTHECEGVLVRPFTRDDLLAALAAAPIGASVTSAY